MNLKKFFELLEGSKYHVNHGETVTGNKIKETRVDIDYFVEELSHAGELDIEAITEVYRRFQDYEEEIRELEERIDELMED